MKNQSRSVGVYIYGSRGVVCLKKNVNNQKLHCFCHYFNFSNKINPHQFKINSLFYGCSTSATKKKSRPNLLQQANCTNSTQCGARPQCNPSKLYQLISISRGGDELMFLTYFRSQLRLCIVGVFTEFPLTIHV